jgi:hypothetical protein
LDEVALDLIGRVLASLVLPDPQDAPPVADQTLVGITVTTNVPGKFGRPEASVRLWEGRVLGTGVPKTAVDEDDKTLTREHEIRLPSPVKAERTLNTEPEPASVQLRSEREFWCRPGAAGPPHPLADPGR